MGIRERRRRFGGLRGAAVGGDGRLVEHATGAGAIFFTVYGEPEEPVEGEITPDPLWRRLEAARQGRVYEVSDDLWMLGIGPTAAVGVVDDLRRHLAEG